MPTRKFRFALDPVLRIRGHEERTRQLAVARIERERVAIEDDLRREQQRLSEGKSSVRDALIGRIDVAAIRAHAGTAMQITRKAHQMVLTLAGLHRRLDAARAELVEARRARRAIELLRERRQSEWKREQDRLEQKSLDELAGAAGRKDMLP